MIIISSSGIGETIPLILERNSCLYENIYLITNRFIWDKEGKAIGIKEPIIHSLNKDETSLRDFPEIYRKVKERKNVILLGDNPEDLLMVRGFPYDHLLRIGFLNSEVEKNLPLYKEKFDFLILNDGSLEEVKSLLEEIIT